MLSHCPGGRINSCPRTNGRKSFSRNVLKSNGVVLECFFVDGYVDSSSSSPVAFKSGRCSGLSALPLACGPGSLPTYPKCDSCPLCAVAEVGCECTCAAPRTDPTPPAPGSDDARPDTNRAPRPPGSEPARPGRSPNPNAPRSTGFRRPRRPPAMPDGVLVQFQAATNQLSPRLFDRQQADLLARGARVPRRRSRPDRRAAARGTRARVRPTIVPSDRRPWPVRASRDLRVVAVSRNPYIVPWLTRQNPGALPSPAPSGRGVKPFPAGTTKRSINERVRATPLGRWNFPSTPRTTNQPAYCGPRHIAPFGPPKCGLHLSVLSKAVCQGLEGRHSQDSTFS